MKLMDCKVASHRALSAEVLRELKELGDRFGVNFKINGGMVGATNGMIKLEFAIQDTAGAVSQAKLMWNSYCRRFGLEAGDLGRTFVSGGTLYRITGIAPNRPKYPIECERVQDKRAFKFEASTVTFALPKKAAA